MRQTQPLIDMLTSDSQVAGHHLDTASKVARSLSRSYGNAWIPRYVHSEFITFAPLLITLTEESKPKEKQHQLPAITHVSEDHRTSQAGLNPHSFRTVYIKCVSTLRRRQRLYNMEDVRMGGVKYLFNIGMALGLEYQCTCMQSRWSVVHPDLYRWIVSKVSITVPGNPCLSTYARLRNI